MKLLILALDSTDYQGKSHEILFSEQIANQGHKVTLVCERVPFGYDKKVSKNIKFHVMPINSQLSWDHLELLMKDKYDVCFSTSMTGAKYVSYIGRKQKIPSVCQCLDVPLWRLKYAHWKTQWEGYIKDLEKCDLIIANTNETKNILAELSEGRLLKKTSVVFYGIASHNADSVSVEETKDQIVFVAGLRWYKGLDLLIYALSLIKNPPRLVVVGIGDGTEMMINQIPFRLVELCNFCGVKVDFLGGVSDSDKFRVIKESRLGVYCDMAETISGMFPLECVYSGVPCIVGDMPINRDRFGSVVEFVKDRFNTGEWARRIEMVLSNYHEFKSKAEKDSKWVLKERSFKSHASKVLNLLNGLVKKKHRSKKKRHRK